MMRGGVAGSLQSPCHPLDTARSVLYTPGPHGGDGLAAVPVPG